MTSRNTIAMPVLLLFAAVAIGLADRPASADVPEAAPAAMVQTSLDPGAAYSAVPAAESFEAGYEAEVTECEQECFENYLMCLNVFPNSFCFPKFELCHSQC